MKEWRYTFDAVSKAEWLAQIKKDLKETSFDSLQTQWWEGEFIEPFHHKEDILEKVKLPEHYFTDPPHIMEWINTSAKDGVQISAQINNALQYGAGSLIFENKRTSLPDWNLWLKGVYQDIVDISIDLSPANQENITSILKDIPNTVIVRLHRDSDSTPDTFNHLFLAKPDQTPQLIYQMRSGKSLINDAVELFSNILRDFKLLSELTNSNDYSRIYRIKIDAESSFVKQVIQLRVIQLVWLNITARFQTPPKKTMSPIEFHIHPIGNINPDQFLINAAAASVSASLTGVIAICVHHMSKENIPGYYERINRNIHHLLALECQIYKGQDPLSGSYTVDYYSAKWTREILDKLSAFH
jgi:hypothetical protein